MQQQQSIVAASDELLAQRLRAAYIRLRRRFLSSVTKTASDYGSNSIAVLDGGIDRAGRRRKAIWPKIAAFLKKHQCDDPERFILAQFEANPSPFPNTFTTEAAWSNYVAKMAIGDIELKNRLKSDFDAFQIACGCVRETNSELSDRDMWSCVLIDKTNGISPLFRYCVAAAELLLETKNALHDAAYSQFLCDPAGYQRCWWAILPEELRADYIPLVLSYNLNGSEG